MKKLKYTHLLNMELLVDFRKIAPIGKTPKGVRQIAPIVGGKFNGEKLKGTVINGNDWVIYQPDGTMRIDVRVTLKTDDDAYIYMQYQGHFVAEMEAMGQFLKGKILEPSQYTLSMTAKFECGDPRYNWLNNLVTVGTGIQTQTGPVYSIFQIK